MYPSWVPSLVVFKSRLSIRLKGLRFYQFDQTAT